MKQQTIKETIQLNGVGLHSGQLVQLQIHPAGANHGIKFKRVDLPSSNVVNADVSQVTSTVRGTTLQNGDAVVSTVEHILAALTGMSVDNVLITLDGPEIPILDGSAAPFIEAIRKAGVVGLEEEQDVYEIIEPIAFTDEVSGAEYMALPSNNDLEVTCMIDFNSPYLGQQYATMQSLDEFAEQFAGARTFVFLHEVEYLFNQGLIKGGDMENAIVIADRKIDQDYLDKLSKMFHKPHIKIDKEGVLNTTELIFKNEPARHKVLDIVGDLSLVGKPIKGKIVARKPGHTGNVAFAKQLKKIFLEQRKLKGKPNYDPDLEPIYNVEQIQKFLPHRHPFLLVDKIIELSKNHVVGIKNITFDQYFFPGHFPNNPLFPGVLQIEALAQTGGILALSTVGDPENWDTYFVKIDNTRFKNKVLPGDTLILKMELMAPIRRGICQMYGTAYVGNKIVSEGELTAQIVKVRNL